jgi:hypothetical protein
VSGFAKHPLNMLNLARWTLKAAPWLPISINVRGHNTDMSLNKRRFFAVSCTIVVTLIGTVAFAFAFPGQTACVRKS